MKALTLAIACVCAPAGAQTIGIHLGSAHFPRDETLHDFNPGVYYKSQDGWTLGALQNSMGRLGAYGGYTFETDHFGLLVGAIYGYQHQDCVTKRKTPWESVTTCGPVRGRILPLVSPSVKLPEVFGLTPRISYIPNFSGSQAIHLSLEHKF